MRVTVLQTSPGHDKAANITRAEALIGQALVEDRPELIVLPEVWSCLGGDRSAKVAASEVLPTHPDAGDAAGPAYAFMRDTARRHGIWVHGGSIVERAGDRLFNTTLAFSPAGTEVARYRKIHLFDITAPDGTTYGESRTFDSGLEVVTYRAGDLTVGCSICYDVRFPELFTALRRAGADLIMVPAAFTVQTGKDHWDVLLRARAIETQCWVAASATTGRHADASGGVRETYGHSLICDPWGHVVARASDGAGFATARIDPALTARVRANMPVMDHRKLA